MKSVLIQQLWLVASMLLLGLVLYLPIRFRFGAAGVEGLVAAQAICLLSGLVVVSFQAVWNAIGMAGFGALAGGGLRVAFAIAGLLAVCRFRLGVSVVLLGCLLSCFYLVALCVETVLLVRQLDRAAKQLKPEVSC